VEDGMKVVAAIILAALLAALLVLGIVEGQFSETAFHGSIL